MRAPVKLNPILSGLACFACREAHDPERLQGICRRCGRPLRVQYGLPRDGGHREPAEPAGRDASLWRFRDVLPLVEGEVSIGKGWTPLLEVEAATWVKDEACNPTGSFKARGMSVAVSMASHLGAELLTAPSAGNAAGALAAYGAAAGLPVVVALPADTPAAFVEECRHYGAEVQLVDGTIAEAGKWLRRHGPSGAFDLSTMREPYRVEGKKTMAYELFEQFGGDLPEVVIYPTGGGTGLVGMWKAFDEMEEMGWIDTRRPRLVAVQAEGCAPVVAAFLAGSLTTRAWSDPRTEALGLRVPSPLGGFLCLRALSETAGAAVAVPETDIAPAARELASASGVDVCPESGAAWAALRRLRESGWIRPGQRTVVFNTGTGLKYR